MSYSYTIRAKTKAEAKKKVQEQFDEVVIKNQACHQRDRNEVLSAAGLFIDKLDEPGESDEVSVFVSGSLTGNWQGSDVTNIFGANFSVAAALIRNVVY